MNEELLEADFQRELAEIEAESMGWTSLEPGMYFHEGFDDTEVLITGQATPAMAGMNVLWVL
jgi:hypothetical protein